MKLITAFIIAGLSLTSFAQAEPVPACKDGFYLIGVAGDNVEGVKQILEGAQNSGQLNVQPKVRRVGQLALFSVQALDASALPTLDGIAALPGSLIECDSEVIPAP